MKIYSITEILEASNNILERKKLKTVKTAEDKKVSTIEPLILNNPVDKKSEIISWLNNQNIHTLRCRVNLTIFLTKP